MTLHTKTHVLHGDWRRRRGTKTDAHLYDEKSPLALPFCQRRIERGLTVVVESGVPCSECLVQAITERRHGR